MILGILAFGGEMPRIAADKLPETAAQVTLDCRLSSGDLVSMEGLTTAIKRAAGLTRPKGAFFTDDGNYFVWSDEKTAAKSPVIGDFYGRIYFTDTSRYLKVGTQIDPIAGLKQWSAGTTYSAGQFALFGSAATIPTTGNYSAGTTYVQGDVVIDTIDGLTYRSLKPNNLAHTPSSNAAWWQLWGINQRWISLVGSNLNHQPDTSPTYWRRDGVGSAISVRAGVPAPANWTAKLFGVGSYNVNVVALDPTGVLSVYNVPTTIADARAAVDGSTTGVANSNALIAVARDNWITSLSLRATKTDSDNTASAYYAAGSVKQQEAVVALFPIIPARIYTFDPPDKSDEINQFEVTQLWREPVSDITVDEHQGA